jgi:hypothetical protein
MKKATLALLTAAAAASMAGIAHAVPFGANNVPPGLENNGGVPPGLGDQSGSLSGSNGPRELSSLGGNNPFAASTFTSVSAVPEGGSGVILLGAGLFALALFGRRLQRSY